MPTSFCNIRVQLLTHLSDVFFVEAGSTRFARECEVDGVVSGEKIVKIIQLGGNINFLS